MLTVRPAAERGRTRLDWLDSWHAFSSADCHDPAWLQVARGAVVLDERKQDAGDGAAVSDEAAVEIVAREPAEVLLFDLP